MVIPTGAQRLPAQISFFLAPVSALLLACLTASGAMFIDRPAGNGYAGSAGAGAACSFHRLSLSANPAGLGSRRAGFSFSRYRPWQIEDIHATEAGFFLDGQQWGTSLSALQTDVTNTYLEHTLQIQVAGIFWNCLTLGLASSVRRLEIRGFGSALYSGDAFGAQIRLLPAFSAGIFVRDVVSSRIVEEELPSILQGGFLLQMPTGFTVSYDARRCRNRRWRHLFGQSLTFKNALRITAGMASNPYQFSLGLSLFFKQMGLHSAIQAHQYLGKTHHYGMTGTFPTNFIR